MTNEIIHGDCLEALPDLPDESIDMVYLDPPFNSGRNWAGHCGASFTDQWGAMDEYIDFLEVRMRACKRVLKTTGSLYLHCDDSASHYIKVMLDDVFGMKNYINEIIWKRSNPKNKSKRFGRVHDTILFYAKARKEFYWRGVYTQLDEEYVSDAYRYKDGGGRKYRKSPCHAPSPGKKGISWDSSHGVIDPPVGNRWSPRRSFPGAESLPEDPIDALDALDAMGRIDWSKNDRPSQIQYFDESKGRPAQDIIDDIQPALGGEITGYPTQKPVALIDRFIRASTNKGDIVLDPFCGSGTTCVAAARAGRSYIGMDKSADAVNITRQRIETETEQGVML